eukprot:gb/GFBE01003214.1/.p1 GENE.gb/GFBE01003214.1/~~gb/GFBE01003214.1/.p1  ORF type:complete len:545 (+),score=74.09 gb/GFBE01003214.1/:1-1635(+)
MASWSSEGRSHDRAESHASTKAATGGRLCKNGCGRKPFGDYSTCCTHCKGASGPHARDCESKQRAGEGVKPVLTEQSGSKRYSSQHAAELAQFLEDSNIKLVRGALLLELRARGAHLPRRQEAEKITLADGMPALVSHEEMKAWAGSSREERFKRPVFVISHCWEAKEHPDPWGYQLKVLCERGGGLETVYKSGRVAIHSHGTLRADAWLFIDYTSIPQFLRTEEDNVFFGRAMENMHLLYSHDATMVLRIEELTPEDAKHDCELATYNLHAECVQQGSVQKLDKNSTPYLERGWCSAERSWASVKRSRGSYDITAAADSLLGAAPLTPKAFEDRLKGGSLKFTHKEDSEAVLSLQKKVFEQAVASAEVLERTLVMSEIKLLGDALLSYKRLQVLNLSRSEFTDSGFKAFLQCVSQVTTLKQIGFSRTGMNNTRASALAEIFQEDSHMRIKHLILRTDYIGDRGVKALASAPKLVSCLTILELENQRRIGDEGAQALADMIRASSILTHLDLRNTSIGALGAKALRETWGGRSDDGLKLPSTKP